MRILLTGATGFAGRAYLKSAVESGHEIIILGRTRLPEINELIQFVETDLTSYDSVKNVSNSIEGEFDVLVNLAAYVPKRSDEDLLIESEKVNVQGLANLLEAFKGRIKKHIFGSTVEVYDHRYISSPLNTHSLTGPLSYYAATKLSGEYIALSYGRKNSVPTTVLRFSVMYGPYDKIARAIPNFIKSAITNQEINISSGRAKRDYLHVSDVVESINKAIEAQFDGVVTIGTGTGVEIQDVAEKIVVISKSSSKIVSDDKSGVDIIIDAEEAKNAINFTAKFKFPFGVDEMIDSYKA